MKVKHLRKALKKFPRNAECWAYEGERIGITIEHKGQHGFISCSDDESEEIRLQNEFPEIYSKIELLS